MKITVLGALAALSLAACVDANGNQTAIGAKVAEIEAQITAVTGLSAEQQNCVLMTYVGSKDDPAFKAMSTKDKALNLAASCGIDTSQYAAVMMLID